MAAPALRGSEVRPGRWGGPKGENRKERDGTSECSRGLAKDDLMTKTGYGYAKCLTVAGTATTLNLKVAVGNPSHDGKTIMNIVATLGIQFLWKNDIKNNIETKMFPVIQPFQTIIF